MVFGTSGRTSGPASASPAFASSLAFRVRDRPVVVGYIYLSQTMVVGSQGVLGSRTERHGLLKVKLSIKREGRDEQVTPLSLRQGGNGAAASLEGWSWKPAQGSDQFEVNIVSDMRNKFGKVRSPVSKRLS